MNAELEAGRAVPAAPGEKPAAGARVPDSKTTVARIEFANTLRGVAALSVIVAHLAGVYWSMGPMVDILTGVPYVPYAPPVLPRFVPLSWLGPFGVALFFTISGFVIPFSLDQYNVKGFIVGRLFRIWPTCWAGLTLTVLAVVLGVRFMGGAVPFGFRDAASQYFPPFSAIADARRIDSVMWTLEIEMFFYGICALAAKHLREGRHTIWLFPLGIFAFWLAVDQIVVRFADYPELVRRLGSFDTDPVFLVFMFCGVALNFYQRNKVGLAGAAGAIALCAGMFCLAQYIGHMPFTADIPTYLGGLSAFIVCMAMQRYFIHTRLTDFLSGISYPLYVVHGVAGYVVLHALMRLHVNSDIAILVAISLAIGVSYLIHRFVELPSHRLGQKYARHLTCGSA